MPVLKDVGDNWNRILRIFVGDTISPNLFLEEFCNDFAAISISAFNIGKKRYSSNHETSKGNFPKILLTNDKTSTTASKVRTLQVNCFLKKTSWPVTKGSNWLILEWRPFGYKNQFLTQFEKVLIKSYIPTLLKLLDANRAFRGNFNNFVLLTSS